MNFDLYERDYTMLHWILDDMQMIVEPNKLARQGNELLTIRSMLSWSAGKQGLRRFNEKFEKRVRIEVWTNI